MEQSYINANVLVSGVSQPIKSVFVHAEGRPIKAREIFIKQSNAWQRVALIDQRVQPRIIAMWTGAISTIPTGWVLCDGTNATPDLRSRFIKGAGTQLEMDEIHNQAEHTHTVNADGAHTHTTSTDSHTHTFSSSYSSGVPSISGTEYTFASNGAHSHTTTADAHNHTIDSSKALPPHYILYYIMKV